MYEIPVDELDIIFISYDEPLKEKFWQKLLSQNAFVKRVDGVTGFDAAHKKAAEIAETDRFITVDGDTIVDDKFFDMTLRFDEEQYGNFVFSWAGTNVVNGLVYGNGSLKCWPRESVLRMQTHENAADERAKIEFCWSLPYLSMRDSYSTTHPASTPYHAFRAGLREGVKMGLDQGQRVDPSKLVDQIWEGNLHKLISWATVGIDHPNGLWAIYGTRMGLNLLNEGVWDFNQLADYKWFEEYWNKIFNVYQVDNGPSACVCEHSGVAWCYDTLHNDVRTLGDRIYEDTGLYLPLFGEEESKCHKRLTSYKERETPVILFEE